MASDTTKLSIKNRLVAIKPYPQSISINCAEGTTEHRLTTFDCLSVLLPANLLFANFDDGDVPYTKLRFNLMIMNKPKRKISNCWFARAVVFAFVFNLSVANAVTTANDERTKIIIAGMLSGFLSYIKWPPSQSGKVFRVGILGEDDIFFNAMERYLKQKTAKNQGQFSVVQATASELDCCQVLMVLSNSGMDMEALLSEVAHLPILTVSDQRDFAAAGGHINFYYQSGKVRFEINWQAAIDSKLKVSSQLLKLARVINKG
ncbi:MAG: hypothetical protein ACI8WB_004470 [Phenylobacterium sp.]|jgi:hypothetical protein